MIRQLIFCFIVFTAFETYGLSPPAPRIGVAKLPAPAADCWGQESPENLKYYKESCSNDSECFGGPTSMVCKDKICQCNENHEPGERFVGEKATQTVCIPAPYLLNKCKISCQKPAKCLPYTGEDAKGQDIKVCQCGSPFIYQDGSCFLTCSKDEFYDSSKFKCIPKCKANEIQVNETCKPLGNLNDKCEIDRQCLAYFSECKSGVCSCREGFSSDKSSCAPNKVSCPFGDALKNGNGFKTCRIFYKSDEVLESTTDVTDQGASAPATKGKGKGKAVGKRPPFPPRPPGRRLKDDCPKGYSCIVISGNYGRENETGYCCPAAINECPVGSPHPSAKCDTSGPGVTYCPWDTHYCHSSSSGGSNKQLCCPKGCPSGGVLIESKCYSKVKVGNKCVKNEQCEDTFSSCNDGVCTCGEGSKQSSSSSYPYCIKECKPDEVLHGKQCEKRLKLSDICEKAREYLCPENGYCNTNNQCACRCGMFTLADNTCAPAPICRPIRPFPMFAKAGLAGEAAPPPVPRISDEERDKLLKNVTFCAIKDKTPPQGIKVVKCSSKEYCGPYISSLGLCCAIPEAKCFSGGKPKNDQQCDFKDPFSCGLDYSCLKYVYPVDQDENSKDNTICCPKSPFDEPIGGFAALARKP